MPPPVLRPRSRRNAIWCRSVADNPAPVSGKAAVINQKLRLRSACAAVQDRSISRAAAGSAPTACDVAARDAGPSPRARAA